MLRKSAKKLAWSFGVVLGLGLIAYCAPLLANKEDRPPSMEIDALLASRPSTPAFTDQRNSYLYVLGFAGPPNADPIGLGLLNRKNGYEITGQSDQITITV
tara:strand:+ start:403 stop:705 length:303 start_codon:yes stop_codon:yes gene_type:complete